jgi:hypothetical protein
MNPNIVIRNIIALCVILMSGVVLVGKASELWVLYIREISEYKLSESRLAKCRRDKESQSIFPDECRAALEHLDHYPFAKALQLMKDQTLISIKHGITGVFDDWTVRLFLLTFVVFFLFYVFSIFQRQQERWQYRQHNNYEPPARIRDSKPDEPFLLSISDNKYIDRQASIYNRKKTRPFGTIESDTNAIQHDDQPLKYDDAFDEDGVERIEEIE